MKGKYTEKCPSCGQKGIYDPQDQIKGQTSENRIICLNTDCSAESYLTESDIDDFKHVNDFNGDHYK